MDRDLTGTVDHTIANDGSDRFSSQLLLYLDRDWNREGYVWSMGVPRTLSEISGNVQRGESGAGEVLLRIDRKRGRSFVGLHCNSCGHGGCD